MGGMAGMGMGLPVMPGMLPGMGLAGAAPMVRPQPPPPAPPDKPVYWKTRMCNK